MTKTTARTQNENERACSRLRASPYPVEAYKDGRLTFSGWLLAVEGCPRSRSNFLMGKTPRIVKKGKELLSRWKKAAYPDLGEWPPEGVELFDYLFGVLAQAVSL